MNSPKLPILSVFLVLIAFSAGQAQQPASSIERARLFQNTPNSTVNADGMELATDESEAASDDSFGTQVILKKRERPKTVSLTGDVSVFFTDNAALTPNDKIDDVLFVTNAGASWTPRINLQLEAQLNAHASIFRYGSTSALDFENLGLGGALFWTPQHFADIALFARYDFIELLDRHSQEILRDHAFTVGGQRIFAIGRSQSFFTLGASVTGDIADPSSAQRQVAAIFAGYHWQITRAFEAELYYRLAGYFYNNADHADCNQVVSGSVRYRLSRNVDLNGFVSFSSNRSDTAGFDYHAVTAGGGIAVTVRF
ncbi:MAG: hypothetical protein M3N48_11755 [Verrucomicrobiota bacterium]|nr:hypothetical protein [Verrucomicrobiota bacterium]